MYHTWYTITQYVMRDTWYMIHETYQVQYLRLEKAIEVPEAALHPSIRRHLLEPHVHQHLAELRPHLYKTNKNRRQPTHKRTHTYTYTQKRGAKSNEVILDTTAQQQRSESYRHTKTTPLYFFNPVTLVNPFPSLGRIRGLRGPTHLFSPVRYTPPYSVVLRWQVGSRLSPPFL